MKYGKWQYNQLIHVWSPNFVMSMLKMAKLRSALFRVPNMQFSLVHASCVRVFQLPNICLKVTIASAEPEGCSFIFNMQVTEHYASCVS